MTEEIKKSTLALTPEAEEAARPKSITSIARSTWNRPGTKTKESLLAVVDSSVDDYDSLTLDEDQQRILEKSLRKMATGAAAFSPMTCHGAQCPFAWHCPLVAMNGHPQHGKAPVNQPCLLEVTLLRDTLVNYLREYEVDPNNQTDLNLCNELAEIEILTWRLNLSLSLPDNATLIVEQEVGVDRQGNPISQQQVSPLFEQKTKLARRKTQIMKLMVGDRQEKYKKEAALKQRNEDDASTQMANIKKRLQSLQHDVNRSIEDQNTIDAEIISPEDIINKAIQERDSQDSDTE